MRSASAKVINRMMKNMGVTLAVSMVIIGLTAPVGNMAIAQEAAAEKTSEAEAPKCPLTLGEGSMELIKATTACLERAIKTQDDGKKSPKQLASKAVSVWCKEDFENSVIAGAQEIFDKAEECKIKVPDVAELEKGLRTKLKEDFVNQAEQRIIQRRELRKKH